MDVLTFVAATFVLYVVVVAADGGVILLLLINRMVVYKYCMFFGRLGVVTNVALLL